MKYMLLIYEEEKARVTDPPEERNQMFAEYGKLTNDIKASGQYVAGAPLQPTSTATSVRVRDGEPIITDGPFAESREQLGGYYLVDAKNLDDAISIAARIPSARKGTVEVRPVMEIGAPATA